MSNTFELKDLEQTFWNKVIFIQIIHSTGMGGPGVIWLITNEKRLYCLGITDLPFGEYELEKLNTLFCYHGVDSTKGFKSSKLGKGGVFIKEEYFDKYEDYWQKVYDADLYKINHVHEPEVMRYVLGDEELERFDLLETVKRREEEEKTRKECEEEHEKKKLTERYFEWKPLYMNNRYCRSFPEEGYYCLLLKEHEGKIYGNRYSIVYQRQQMEPFAYKHNAPIELYIVFEKDYGVIDGRLSFNDPKETGDISIEYAELWDDLEDCDLNDYGKFERALPTLEDAKKYVMVLANRAQFNIENTIDPSDRQLLMKYEYENIKLKHEAIIGFGKNYKEIMQAVAEYEFPENSGGGYYMVEDILKKIGIERKLATKMLFYIPDILLPKNQRKSQEILKMNEERYLSSIK